MKAGRELDALIAEKVMGCKVLRAGGMVMCDCLRYPLHDVGNNNELRAYSTDIAAAFEVVEKLQAAGFKWALMSRSPIMSDSRVVPHARLWNYSEGVLTTDKSADADTLSLAICLAALKAVGVSVGGEG